MSDLNVRSQAISFTGPEKSLAEILGVDRQDIVVLRNSERQTFRRCRRKWFFEASSRLSLQADVTPHYFWTGSAFHAAMYDYHGANIYGHPVKALEAHLAFCQEHSPEGLPEDWEMHFELCKQMAEYYADDWLLRRDPLETYTVDGIPQTEVRSFIQLPEELVGHPRVYYAFTIDRVVYDRNEDGLYILDYKTYKDFSTHHIPFDPQLTSYMWAANHLYDKPILGAILQQHRKAVPAPPRVLSNGLLSTAKNQSVSYNSYYHALIERYGTEVRIPPQFRDFLEGILEEEAPDRDRFIRRDYTERSNARLLAEERHLIAEAREMVNDQTPIYPNFTRDCKWQCPYLEPCNAMDEDEDWQEILRDVTRRKKSDYAITIAGSFEDD